MRSTAPKRTCQTTHTGALCVPIEFANTHARMHARKHARTHARIRSLCGQAHGGHWWSGQLDGQRLRRRTEGLALALVPVKCSMMSSSSHTSFGSCTCAQHNNVTAHKSNNVTDQQAAVRHRVRLLLPPGGARKDRRAPPAFDLRRRQQTTVHAAATRRPLVRLSAAAAVALHGFGP
jgi:hypothetical protein